MQFLAEKISYIGISGKNIMRNGEIADLFEQIADVLEFKGENSFRVNAYRKSARIIREYPEDVEMLWKEDRLTEIPGVGQGIADHIMEYLKTGKIQQYQEVLSGMPEGILDLINIPNIGPKTVSLFYNRLDIKNLDDLEKEIKKGTILNLPGMGEKKIENIKKGIIFFKEKQKKKRISLGIALPIVKEIIDYMKPGVEKISACGSLRRMKETIGDIDILTTGENHKDIIETFINFPKKENIIAKGQTKASIIVKEHHLQVDLRVVDNSSYGSALLYFTGSKEHNIKLRGLAKDKGFKISEYGIFKGDEKIAGQTEESVYDVLNMQFIPPELREDRGEIEAAINHKLPHLVKINDILGDMHSHTNYSDGMDTIETMVQLAIKHGYKFIVISDHTKTSKIANGMDEEKLKKRNKEIDIIQEKYPEIKIVKAVEIDILGDGQLDYSDEILKDIEFVIGAIHQGFQKNVTERMIKAIKNPFLDIIAHPTGRLISGRKGYDINLDEVISAAVEYNVALEINAYFDRLDLNDINIIKAKNRGAMFSIGTDSHNAGMLKYMEFGISMARRGWLEKNDILNCYQWNNMPRRNKK